jgi:hypothetical protein
VPFKKEELDHDDIDRGDIYKNGSSFGFLEDACKRYKLKEYRLIKDYLLSKGIDSDKAFITKFPQCNYIKSIISEDLENYKNEIFGWE